MPNIPSGWSLQRVLSKTDRAPSVSPEIGWLRISA